MGNFVTCDHGQGTWPLEDWPSNGGDAYDVDCPWVGVENAELRKNNQRSGTHQFEDRQEREMDVGCGFVFSRRRRRTAAF